MDKPKKMEVALETDEFDEDVVDEDVDEAADDVKDDSEDAAVEDI